MAYIQPLDTRYFPASYSQAALLWQENLPGLLNPVVKQFPHLSQGPNGEALATQVGWIGRSDAAKVMVLIAGTHGVEGYAGTAIQCDHFQLLQSGELLLPEDMALLVIHGLNPWGYAWNRRCDSEGIDVNRNFVDFTHSLPDNPGYNTLRQILMAEDSPEKNQSLLEFRQQMGDREFEIALSGGQYLDPQMPFYGGQQPSFSRKVIEDLMAEYSLAKRQLAVVDLHTGLGPFSYGEVICDHPPGSTGEVTARRWYGPSCMLSADGTSCSVPKLGLLDYAWHDIMNENSCFITLEVGTLGNDILFKALAEDNALWRRYFPGIPPDYERTRVAEQMIAHFNPEDNTWREAVLFRGRQVIRLALDGLAAPTP